MRLSSATCHETWTVPNPLSLGGRAYYLVLAVPLLVRMDQRRRPVRLLLRITRRRCSLRQTRQIIHTTTVCVYNAAEGVTQERNFDRPFGGGLGKSATFTTLGK